MLLGSPVCFIQPIQQEKTIIFFRKRRKIQFFNFEGENKLKNDEELFYFILCDEELFYFILCDETIWGRWGRNESINMKID